MKQNNFRNKPQRMLEKQWKKRIEGHNDFELQTYAQADGNSRLLKLKKKTSKSQLPRQRLQTWQKNLANNRCIDIVWNTKLRKRAGKERNTK